MFQKGVDIDMTLAIVTDTTTDGYTINTATTGDYKLTDGATIVGSAGKDAITGSEFADTITGGLGADTIKAGKGNDTIDLREAVSSADIVEFSAVADNGNDTIIGFTADATATKDTLKVSTLQTLTTDGNNNVLQGIASSTAKVKVTIADATTDGNGVILIKDQAATDWSDVGTVIGNALTVHTTAANNGKFVILIDNGTDTRVYNYADVTNGFAATDDLTLVATVTGVQTHNGTTNVFDAGNFA